MIFQRVDLPPIKPKALLMEVPVAPEVTPVLVTGVDTMIWVQSVAKGFARTYIRKTSVTEEEVLREIAAMSIKCQWGNMLPATEEGFKSALKYLSDYGFAEEDLELLGPKDLAKGKIQYTKLRGKYTLLLPKDRAYIGWLTTWSDGRSTAVIHNAARGIVIMTPGAQHDTSST